VRLGWSGVRAAGTRTAAVVLVPAAVPATVLIVD